MQLAVSTCAITDSYDYPTTDTYHARARNPAAPLTIAQPTPEGYLFFAAIATSEPAGGPRQMYVQPVRH